MRIQSVQIRNFRSLKDVTIEFDSVTTLIGPNGAGKSTVLRALDWFFNGKPGDLDDQDCSFGATDEDIEVRVTFSSLTEKDTEELGRYVPDGVETFTAWKRRTPEGTEVVSANAKGLPDFNRIKMAPNATAKKDFYKELRENRPELGLPAANSGTAVDQAITAWEAANTEQLVDLPEALQTNFFGFNSGGKMSGLFDFVLVTADLRASEESLDARASIIGRILERSVDRTAADEEIAQIVEESRIKQQQVYNEKFKERLDELTKQLNTVVGNYSPGRAIAVAPSDVELKAPRTTFNVSIIDGETQTSVERQGHGFQRTLLISALQVLAESGSASSEGVICLAIEEPELFQHPIQAQTFAKVLRSLAEDEGKRIQVTYATHSPYFVEAQHFDQVRRLTRRTDRIPCTSVTSATVENVREKLAGIVKRSTVDQQLDSIVTSQISIALFAHRVLLVEGTTELAVFYGLGDRENIGSLEAKGVSIVPVGGKTSVPLIHAILTSLGIPTYALFDGDDGFEQRARKNGKSEDKISEERNKNIRENKLILKYFGMKEVDFPTAQVSSNVAIFNDNLEGHFAEHWVEWQTSCDEVEAQAMVSLKKNQAAYRIATLKAAGTVPSMLTEILSSVMDA